MFDRKEYMKEYHRKWYLKNKKTVIKNNKKYHELNKEKIKVLNQKLHLKNKYSLTFEQYNKILESQNDVCAICKNKEISLDSIGNIRELAVDHNHITGNIRGLLCNKCNRMIGFSNDNKQVLINAIEYLTKE
jgi:hypothetical protein